MSMLRLIKTQLWIVVVQGILAHTDTSLCLDLQDAGASEQLTVSVASGASLPDFAIQAMDQWDNATQPCAEMPFDLVITSDKLDPQETTVHFDPIASVQGGQQL